MRVLILTPTALPDPTGNATTVERLRRGLAARGDDVRVVAIEPAGRREPRCAADVARAVRDLAPDVVHAYHAWRCGRLLLDPEVAAAAGAVGAALVVSLPGTDVERDLADPARRPAILAACGRAGALVVHSEATLARLREAAPDLAPRARLCPKSVTLGEAPFDLRGPAGAGPGDVLFFLPAGLRPIKGNLFPVAPLVALAGEGLQVRLVLAGPVLDDAYAREVRAALDASGGVARRLPPVPLDAMGAAHAASDVVLNTSEMEGLANTLLEAAVAGRAVLASDIPGNRAVVSPGETGLLYRPRDATDFGAKARALAADPALRARLGAEARARVLRERPPEAEIEALRAAYQVAIEAT